MALTWLNGCFASYSDWDFATRLFFPARRKSLDRNWPSARGLENKSLRNLCQLRPNQSRPTGFWNKARPTRFLIVPANVYCDGRLLAALSARNSPTVLVDSNPPQFVQHMIRNPCGPALVTRDFLLGFRPAAPVFEELKNKTDNRQIEIIDAAEELTITSSACAGA